MVRKPVRQGSSTAKRSRRRATAGQGRLEPREITSADVHRVAQAGNIPDDKRQSFGKWLRPTLDFCWLLDRHYRPDSNKTLSAKKTELTQLYHRTHRVKKDLNHPRIRQHLIGAALQRRVLGKSNLSAIRYQWLAQATGKRMRRVVRDIGWLIDLLDHDLKHLERRGETGDEQRARTPASKPAIEHLTGMIIQYWRGQLGRAPKVSAMAAFATAVFKVAGERGVLRETAAERLKAALRSRAG